MLATPIFWSKKLINCSPDVFGEVKISTSFYFEYTSALELNAVHR